MTARLELDGWETGLKFAAAHFLPGVERCNRIHGHNYAVSVRIEGEVTASGLVLDFNLIKKKVREIVEELDHRMLLPSNAKEMKIERTGGQVSVEFEGKRYSFPEQETVLIPVEHVSAEELSRYIAQRIIDAGILGRNVRILSTGVAEGRGQEAWAELKLQ